MQTTLVRRREWEGSQLGPRRRRGRGGSRAAGVVVQFDGVIEYMHVCLWSITQPPQTMHGCVIVQPAAHPQLTLRAAPHACPPPVAVQR